MTNLERELHDALVKATDKLAVVYLNGVLKGDEKVGQTIDQCQLALAKWYNIHG